MKIRVTLSTEDGDVLEDFKVIILDVVDCGSHQAIAAGNVKAIIERNFETEEE